MAKNNIWSKIGKFLKTTFTGGWHWDKENGWQSISDYVAENPEASNIASSFNGVGGNSSKNGLLGNLFNKFTGGGLTDAESQMNDFNASQAEADRAFQSYEAALQRDWSAQEAERARDWQEEMYTKYNSLSGKIAQAEQAGVNPMLAVTGNAVSPMSASSPVPSGASPSGSRASGGGFAHQSFTDLIGMVLGLAKSNAEIDLMKSEAEKNRSDAERTGWLSKLSEREYKIITENDFDIQEIESRIGLNKDQATAAFELAGKYFEEAGKIATEKGFLEKTEDDRAKVIEYDKLIKEFESSMSTALDSLENNEKLSLKEWVSVIFKTIFAMK